MYKKFLFIFLLLIFGQCQKQEQQYNYTTSLKNNPIIHLYYFYSPDCADCEYMKKILFPRIENENKVVLQIDYLNIDEPENLEKVLFLEEKLKKTVSEFPVVFWGNTFLAGDSAIESHLSSNIAQYKKLILKQNKIKIYLKQFNKTKLKKSLVLKNVKLVPIIVSGLLDGINPCAFSTIIFLISFLTFMKFQSKKILFIGIFYTFGVFLFYFLSGFGAFRILKSLLIIKQFAIFIKYMSIFLLVLLLGFSIFDIMKSLRTKSFDFSLSLPLKIKQKIHAHIRTKLNSKFLFFSAFILGCFISFLELACTGQIYLPTILYMLQDPTLKFKGIGLLLVYNLFFIIPLIVIFIFAYFGFALNSVKNTFQKNILIIKIFTALLFLLILVFLVFN